MGTRTSLIIILCMLCILIAGCEVPKELEKTDVSGKTTTETTRSNTKVKSKEILTINIPAEQEEHNKEPIEEDKMTNYTKVLFETNKGNITIQLKDSMKITAGNFEKLVREGFYDGTIFHRVIKNFMIQGGDPKGDGTGGPGYTIQDEFGPMNQNNRGTISMANAGPNTGGSQFFINVVNNNFLDSKHPVFGKVVEGMDVVDAITAMPVNRNDRPLEEVKIIKASII